MIKAKLTKRMEAVPPNEASTERRLLNLVDLTWYLQEQHKLKRKAAVRHALAQSVER